MNRMTFSFGRLTRSRPLGSAKFLSALPIPLDSRSPRPSPTRRGRIVRRRFEMTNGGSGSGDQCANIVGEISPALSPRRGGIVRRWFETTNGDEIRADARPLFGSENKRESEKISDFRRFSVTQMGHPRG